MQSKSIGNFLSTIFEIINKGKTVNSNEKIGRGHVREYTKTRADRTMFRAEVPVQKRTRFPVHAGGWVSEGFPAKGFSPSRHIFPASFEEPRSTIDPVLRCGRLYRAAPENAAGLFEALLAPLCLRGGRPPPDVHAGEPHGRHQSSECFPVFIADAAGAKQRTARRASRQFLLKMPRPFCFGIFSGTYPLRSPAFFHPLQRDGRTKPSPAAKTMASEAQNPSFQTIFCMFDREVVKFSGIRFTIGSCSGRKPNPRMQLGRMARNPTHHCG